LQNHSKVLKIMIDPFEDLLNIENYESTKKPMSQSIRENMLEIAELIQKYESFVKNFGNFKKKTKFLLENGNDNCQRSTLKISEILETNSNIILLITNNFDTLKLRFRLLKNQNDLEEMADENRKNEKNERGLNYVNSGGLLVNSNKESISKNKNLDLESQIEKNKSKIDSISNEESLFSFLNI